ncbi:WHG domain-containing protein [Caballeronia sp. dw_19]|uniref:TetR/AcrR family transcriptional regulator n=1 Tax=unclassified Caballeronia TaxID=2646786 RepID=UPI001BD6A6C0|nr:WHG domain-containing protein [Caballeronia sp. dw_19]
MSEASAHRKTPARTPAETPPISPARDKPYHHGALPEALLQAAESVLRRDGLRGLTLRAIAREAGVSHTAPQHHFGDIAGVLSELAATGHRRLAATMAQHATGIERGKARRKAIARGYVSFAVNDPDLFRLMSRNELLDQARPSLIEGRQVSMRGLAGVFGDDPEQTQGEAKVTVRPDATQAVAMTAAWAYVHGLALLLIDGRLSGLAKAAEGVSDAEQLVDAAIEHLQIVPDSDDPARNTHDYG